MFLRWTTRIKNGKEHRYCSIVENKRCAGGRIVQRHVLYLGEINDRQEAAWQKTIDIFKVGQSQPRPVALFPEDRGVQVADTEIVRIKLSELQLLHPRQWGRAGWRAICMKNCNWTDSGPSGSSPVAKARVGIWCCKLCVHTD